MKEETVRKIALIACMASLLAISATAQTSSSTSADQGTGEAYLGYQHTTGDIGENGWNISGAKYFGEHFAAEGDLAGQYGSASLLGVKVNQHEYSFLFGPKVMFTTNDEKLTPWAHLLLGGAHQGFDSNIGANDGDTSFAWALGGGVDYHITNNVSARGKLDLYHTSYFSNGDSHARFGFGIVYNFGR